MASLHSIWTSVSGKFNGVFISCRSYISRQQRISATQNANLTFIVLSLFGILQIKFQAGNSKDSPFSTHPKTWTIAIVSLLLYGLAYDAEQRLSSTYPSYANVVRHCMGLLGVILVGSLASILFSGWMLPVLLFVYFCFYVGLMNWLEDGPEEMDNSPV